ncbi:helix-turn-helix domain-containing protein [Rhizobium leguminosarum]|nr:helix-turn-helix domain-containing protein [Rhizobium leguminosarum]
MSAEEIGRVRTLLKEGLSVGSVAMAFSTTRPTILRIK